MRNYASVFFIFKTFDLQCNAMGNADSPNIDPQGLRSYSPNTTALFALKEQVERLQGDVRDIKLAVTGGSRAEEGFAFRLARLEDWRKGSDITRYIQIILLVLIFAALVGNAVLVVVTAGGK